MITVLESGKIVSGPKLCTCVSYSVFSTLADGPLSPPSSHQSPSPLHHSTPTYVSPFLTPFLIITSHRSPHPSLDHSHLPLLRPLALPSPLPHTTHNSSLLPHTAPLSVAGTRNNVAVMIDDAFLFCAVSLPVQKTVLQLDRLAKFMKEKFM